MIGHKGTETQRVKGEQFALCVKNRGYYVSLELLKLYQVMPDSTAATHGQIRIVDESGEVYLYPEECFEVREVKNGAKDT